MTSPTNGFQPGTSTPSINVPLADVSDFARGFCPKSESAEQLETDPTLSSTSDITGGASMTAMPVDASGTAAALVFAATNFLDDIADIDEYVPRVTVETQSDDAQSVTQLEASQRPDDLCSTESPGLHGLQGLNSVFIACKQYQTVEENAAKKSLKAMESMESPAQQLHPGSIPLADSNNNSSSIKEKLNIEVIDIKDDSVEDLKNSWQARVLGEVPALQTDVCAMDAVTPVSGLAVPTIVEEIPDPISQSASSGVPAVSPLSTVGQLSVITSTWPRVLGKTYRFDQKLIQETSANMAKADVNVRNFGSVDDLTSLLKGVTVSQALCASLPKNGKITNALVTKAALARSPGAITRSKDDFAFGNGKAGVLILDYDPADTTALSRDVLWQNLLAVCPELAGVGVIWWCSSSSYIYVDEKPHQNLRGQRFYIMVQDTSDIPRAGRVLSERLWLAGHGRVQITKSGQRLLRDLFDRAMHEVARLDFIGGAVCVPPVRQDRGEPVSLGGSAWLDTTCAIPDLTKAQTQRLKDLVFTAKENAREAALAVQRMWISERKSAYVQALQMQGVDRQAAEMAAQAALSAAVDNKLYSHMRIQLAEGQCVTVLEILDSPEKFNYMETLDPLEPEYGGSRPVGRIYADVRGARIYSMAHGGATYLLCRGTIPVVLRPGYVHEFVESVATYLSLSGDIYVQNGSLVQVLPGQIVPLTEYALKLLIAQRIEVKKYLKEALVGADIPQDIPRMILARVTSLPFRSLRARVSLPCMTPEGRELSQSGYDAQTQLYVDLPPDYVPPVYAASDQVCSRDELVVALKALWRPWSCYQFDNPVSRAAALCAILTAINRLTLDLAPGFAVDASTQAVGKTRLAQALNALVSSDIAQGQIGMPAKQRAEDEFAKLVLSMTRSGSNAMLVDNINEILDSAYLAQMISAHEVSARILHTNQMHVSQPRIFLTFTGNNLQMSTDMLHRLLQIRVEPAESAKASAFPFNPVTEVINNRSALAAHALTVMRAYVRAGMPQVAVVETRFDNWIRLIRNSVLWLTRTGVAQEAGIGELGDPVEAFRIHSAVESDPESAILDELLRALSARFGDRAFRSNEIEAICNTRPEVAEERIIRGCFVELGTPGREITAIAIGMKLNRFRDRVRNGLKIVLHRNKTDNGSRFFSVQRVTPA